MYCFTDVDRPYHSFFLIVLFLTSSILFGCQRASSEVVPTNIIVMLADDMGYSDLSCFGSEVPTPQIDRLGQEGATFTQFYNGARCCPTRASLLTGVYPHQAGVGYMTANWGDGSYQGHLNQEVLTMGEVMQRNGYTTFHTGKWHVGNHRNNQTPNARGFDQSWWRQGRVHYFDTSPGMIYLNDSTWTTDDPDYYLTDYTADYAIRFMEQAVESGQPFFGYIGWDACHWPLHAKEEHITLYRDQYRKGWDVLREERISAQRELGLLDDQWDLPGRDPALPAWEDIPADEQDEWVAKMAAYAGQLHSLNDNIGRITQRVEELGIADNTVILFLFDNGACAEAIGWNNPHTPGTPESYIAYHMPWANLSNTPFRSYKHFLYEGGISTPMLMWGGPVPEKKVTAMAHILDIMPTVVDLAGGEYPTDPAIPPMEGQSLVPLLQDDQQEVHDWMFWEHEGNRAVRYGNWKLVSRFAHDTTYFQRWHFPVEVRNQEWELYNVEDDRTELHELSAEHPDLVAEMSARWQTWANRVGVIEELKSYDGKRLKDKH